MTPEPHDQFLLEAADVAEGRFREAQAEQDGKPVWLIVTRHEGTIRAWLNVCPHAGRSLNWAPDRFLVDDAGHLVCAAHGAVFEASEGRCIAGPCPGARLRKVPVAERNGRIYLVAAS